MQIYKLYTAQIMQNILDKDIKVNKSGDPPPEINKINQKI